MSDKNISPAGFFGAFVGMLTFSVIAGILVTVMVTPALAVTGIAANNTIGIFSSLPEFIDIGQQPQQNEIFVTNGKNSDGTPKYVSIAVVFDQNREEVSWDNVSDFLKHAVVAGEDRRFYQHGGIDLTGLIRATAGNVIGTSKSGGSTLAMQLVKNIFIQRALQLPTQELRDAGVKDAQRSTIDRKLKEMKLAIGLEKTYTKDQVLLAYLNIAGFGGNTYGIQAAAQRYYGVSAKDVTLAQAASLIAIVQEPGARSLDNPDNYQNNKDRRNFILNMMFTEKMIDQAQLTEALDTPVDDTTVKLQPSHNGCIAANQYAKQFCDYVVKNVKNLEALGADAKERSANWHIGGYKLYTSLDLRLQKNAQNTIRAFAPPGETRFQLGSAASSVEVGTGRILMMAQNKLFNDSLEGGGRTATAVNFNTDRAYGGSSGFQVGSTYKVFTLLNWLQSGHGLSEVEDANPRTESQAKFLDTCNGPYGGNWTFKNSSGEKGTMTVLKGLIGSVNAVFASMAMQLDQCNTLKIAQALGVHRAADDPYTPEVEQAMESNPAAILGTNTIAPLTIAAAYAGIASGGTYCRPTAVDFVVNAAGEKLPGQAKECSVALDPEVAATAAYAMQAGYATYASNARDGIPMIAKTGTTDKAVQTWMSGSTTKVATSAWFGNIVGNYSIYNYNGGLANRFGIGKSLFSYTNKLYGGGAFPGPAARLLIGAGIQVPTLAGGTLENSKALLEGLGLTFANGGEVDSDLPIGTVVRSSPAAGKTLARGMKVKVYTSNGSMSIVPDVTTTGLTFADAKTGLEASGFTNVLPDATCVETADPTLVDKVISSNPAPGTPWVRTAPISLGVGRLTCVTP